MAIEWEDDFNRADSGTVGNNWDEVETVAISSNTCYFSDVTGQISNKVATAVAPTRIDFKFKLADTGITGNNILIGDTGARITYFRVTADYIQSAETGAWVNLAAMSDNTYIIISMRNINYVAETFDFWIDGVEDSTGNGFANSINNIDYMQFYNFKSNCNIDYITFPDDLPATGTNFQVNVNDAWKEVSSIQVNVNDAWKAVNTAYVQKDDSWKEVFS